MKKNILFIILLFSNIVLADQPKWVNEPDKVCKKHQICAVGTALGRALAEADARSGIAKVFETKIKSKFSQTISSHNDDVSTEMREQIQEEVDQSIEGIEIDDSYEGKMDYYAFAILDKRKAAKGFRTKIKNLDEKMQVLISDKSATSVRQVAKMFKTREALNYRLQFLAGSGIPAKISYEEVFKKNKALTKGVVLYVDIDEQEPKEIEPVIISSLTKMGYKIVQGEQDKSAYTHAIRGRFTAEKQFLNVAGFEKYKFLLNITSSNKAGKQSGSLEYVLSKTGRSFTHAISYATPHVRKYLSENLDGLNIE